MLQTVPSTGEALALCQIIKRNPNPKIREKVYELYSKLRYDKRDNIETVS